MSSLLRMLLAAAFCGAFGRGAWGAIGAALAEGSGGRGWEMIAVEFSRAAGMVEVSVQDARGGPAMVRRVPGDAGAAWLSLPLEVASGLTGAHGGTWPVEVVVRLADGGRELERTRVELALGNGGGSRVAVPGSVGLGANALAVRVSEEDILTAPALVFAGCDAVFLPPELQGRITQGRALELLAAGVRLFAPVEGTSGPPGGGLSGLVWERTSMLPDAEMWMTAAPAVRRPAVVEPGLGPFTEGAGRVTVPGGVMAVILVTGPLAGVLVVVQWGLFRRRRVVLAMSALAMVVVAGGAVVYLGAQVPRQETLAQWRQARGSDATATGGVMLEERLAQCTALFGGPVAVDAEPGGQLVPVAATMDEYWRMRTLRLTLDSGTRLAGKLPARATLHVESRRATSVGLLPAFPTTAGARARLLEVLGVGAAEAWWLIGGYVKHAGAPEEPGVLLATWAAGQPWMAGGGAEGGAQRLAWYDMRFEQGHRYLLFRRDGIMNLVDYGSAEAPAQESDAHP